MTKLARLVLGRLIVDSVLLIRAIWFECGEENKDLFVERVAEFVGGAKESLDKTYD